MKMKKPVIDEYNVNCRIIFGIGITREKNKKPLLIFYYGKRFLLLNIFFDKKYLRDIPK